MKEELKNFIFDRSKHLFSLEDSEIIDQLIDQFFDQYQPERSKREDLINELDKFKPKTLKPEDGYFPPPWNINDHLEKSLGWFEFQKAMKKDPNYY